MKYRLPVIDYSVTCCRDSGVSYNRPSKRPQHVLNICLCLLEKAIGCRKNVLVHCVGGVSRSSTVVIAYLMLKHGYSLNDAFDHVKAKKSNISPNFNFMQQLLDIERTQAPEEGSEISISGHSSFENQISDLPNNIS